MLYNLVVFGSLLNPNEWEKQGISLEKIDYVKVKGFKRIFNQEPSWRKIESQYRAVMNIEEDENSWFNAILVKDLNEDDIKELDVRERGYDRINIAKENIVNYKGIYLENCIVYKGKEGKQNNYIFPNKEYFRICLDGANSHFEEFAKDYLETTYSCKDGQVEKIEI